MDLTYIKSLKTPIAIVGLGKSGLSALNLLQECGLGPQDLLTFDSKDQKAQFTDSAELMKYSPKTLVVSPGVPLNSDWLVEARASGVHVTSEISLAASMLTTERVIGVTGSVGKSTVTSLLGEGIRAVTTRNFVGGNLGIPFCNYGLSLVKGGKKAEWIILELSSYQLENSEKLVLENSIITFLSSNHLERYADLNEYYMTKLKITQMTKNVCLINRSSADAVVYSARSVCKTALINAQNLKNSEILKKLFLLGAHNKDNFSLAAEMADECGWPERALEQMSLYRGLPHRMEYVITLNGVHFINDSKATAMDSVLVAVSACLENISNDHRLILMLGGKDKNLPWHQLNVLAEKANVIPVFFGQCGMLVKEKSGLAGEYFEKLGSAIEYSSKRAKEGDTVLLSPGGTSLDEFRNFEERGDFFKSLVLSSVEA